MIRNNEFRWGKRLPALIKAFLQKNFWSAKSLLDDLQDYCVEAIGNIPSHGIRLWWYRHICRIQIGKHSSIHRKCRMYQPERIKIGENSVINYGILLDGRRGLTIGNNVSISEGTVILSLGHDIDDPDFNLQGGEVIIDDYVFIGSYARVLPNVRIGKGAVVAAGAVVTRNVEPYTVVGGIPARYIRDRSRDLRYHLNFRKRFG